jgi:hypothetical protein
MKPDGVAEALASLRVSEARDARTFRVLSKRASRRERTLADLLAALDRARLPVGALRPAEVARELGVSARSVARWCAAGRFGAEGEGWHRAGRSVRITEAGMEHYRHAGKQSDEAKPKLRVVVAIPTPAPDWRALRAARHQAGLIRPGHLGRMATND